MHVYLYNVKYFESQYVNISYDTLNLLQQLNFSKIIVYFEYSLIGIYAIMLKQIFAHFLRRPNFLIMDEPTNHLDMETIEALGKSLLKFQVRMIILQSARNCNRIPYFTPPPPVILFIPLLEHFEGIEVAQMLPSTMVVLTMESARCTFIVYSSLAVKVYRNRQACAQKKQTYTHEVVS